MRQLVVLVGLPGSGKTAFHQRKSGWVVVSKDVIRQSMFGHSFEPGFEDIVDRIFSAALIETTESSAEVVCIDDLNLLRKERRSYVELGQMTDRQSVAVVMPYDPIDDVYQLAQFQLEELAKSSPRMTVAKFPRDRFDAMSRCYEAVQPEEGFARIMREEKLPMISGITKAEIPVRSNRKRREEKQHPIPLFADRLQTTA